MLNQTRINYAAVAHATSQVESIAQNAISTLNADYDRILSDVDEFDGATQAALREAVELNRAKAITTINTVRKLARFMANSSERIRQLDTRIASNMNLNVNNNDVLATGGVI